MKKNVALVTGGFTGEHVISEQSAEVVGRYLDTTLFNVYKILITREGWFYVPESGERTEVDKNDFSIRDGTGEIHADVAFIAIHGSPGEDGKLQGYFDMLQIPYTSCNTAVSAITMNKTYTKAVLRGIDSLSFSRSVQLFKHLPYDEKALAGLNLPLFVKPNNGGSSIGMSRVTDREKLGEAISRAFQEDEQVMVEEFIKGREFSIGAAKLQGEVKVFPPTEIIPAGDFFDYEAKYLSGKTQEITPALLNDAEHRLLNGAVKDIYERLDCHGMIRIDFILEEGTGRLFLIEINTIPGQTENSLIPQQVRAAGMDIQEFYTMLIHDAIGVRIL